MLRHTLATLAYRSAKTLRNIPPDFGSFHSAAGTRTPVEILSHISDLLDWAICLADGSHVWNAAKPQSWDAEVRRFFAAMEQLDRRLASDEPLAFPAERLFQGPIADALTHVGQIAMLRRMAGVPVHGENYFRADIVCGRVGPGQAEPVTEFK